MKSNSLRKLIAVATVSIAMTGCFSESKQEAEPKANPPAVKKDLESNEAKLTEVKADQVIDPAKNVDAKTTKNEKLVKKYDKELKEEAFVVTVVGDKKMAFVKLTPIEITEKSIVFVADTVNKADVILSKGGLNLFTPNKEFKYNAGEAYSNVFEVPMADWDVFSKDKEALVRVHLEDERYYEASFVSEKEKTLTTKEAVEKLTKKK